MSDNVNNEVWSEEEHDIVEALQSPTGRVFRRRDGAILDRIRLRSEQVRMDSAYSCQCESTHYYYAPNGRMFENCVYSEDIVAVQLLVHGPPRPNNEDNPRNPDFLFLLSFAKDEESAKTIKKAYASFRLLPDLTLRVLGYTGKRKSATWEQFPGLMGLLDVDRMFDSVPWTIASGEDVHEVFRHHRPGSCMRGEDCYELVHLYALNPDQVKVAYRTKESCGLMQSSVSCLVWYGKDTVYIDRRYSNGYRPNTKEPMVRSLARQLERETGKPVRQVWKGENIEGLELIDKPVQFTLHREHGAKLPWMDSICYLVDYDDDSVTISTSQRNGRECIQDSSGYNLDGPKLRCCSCGCRVDEDDSQCDENGRAYCNDCYSDAFSYCNWNELEYSADDVSERRVYSYGSAYAHRNRSRCGQHVSPRWQYMNISDYAISNEFTELQDGMYCHNDLVVEDNRGNYYAPDDDDNYVITEDGEVYHPDDAVQCLDGTVQPKEDCTELHDGTWCLTSQAVEVDEEWYHEDNLPDGYKIDDAPVEASEKEEASRDTQPETTSIDHIKTDLPYRVLSPDEIIQEGDYCAGWNRVEEREWWFLTGDAGLPVKKSSLQYVRFEHTSAAKEQVNS